MNSGAQRASITAQLRQRYNKPTLQAMRCLFDIDAKASFNKTQLSNMIFEALIDKEAVDGFLSILSQAQFSILLKQRENNGLMLLDEAEDDDLLFADILVFRDEHSGGADYLLPETAQYIREFDTPEHRVLLCENAEIVKLAGGLLYYYGAMTSIDLFSKMIDLFKSEEATTEQRSNLILRILKILSFDYPDLAVYEIDHENDIYFHFAVDDPDTIIDEQNNLGHPFKSIAREKLLAAGSDEDYYESTPQLKRLLHWVAANVPLTDIFDAKNIILDSMDALNNGAPMGNVVTLAINEIADGNLDLDRLNKFMQLFSDFANNFPYWVLRGNTPAELEIPNSFSTTNNANVVKGDFGQPKISGNNFCPCGSGKKYKKCCGKDE